MMIMKTLPGIVLTAMLILLAGPFAWAGSKHDGNGWHLSAYCSYKRHHPSDFIDRDNNFEIMLALREPKTFEQLYSEGVACTKEQLKFLRKGGIIRKNGDGTWATVITMLDKVQTARLRDFSRSFSGDLYHAVKEDFKSFVNELSERGWEDNAYSVCFSYILDDKCWNYLVDPEDIKACRYWSGCAWYLFGERQTPSPGTNQIGTISQTWNPNLALNIDYYLLMDMNKSLSKSKTATFTGDLLERMKAAGLADPTGRVLLPVIEENGQNPLSIISDRIGKKVAEELSQHIDECDVLASVVNRDAAKIILCHELIWDIMEQLLADGLVKMPAAFLDSPSKDNSELRKIVYLCISL